MKENTSQRANPVTAFQQLISQLQERTGKEVELSCSGFNELPLDDQMVGFINDMTIQFIRNALMHGVESPDKRQHLQKSRCARIDCRLAMRSSGLELQVQDDGSGIDYGVIMQRAVQSGLCKEDEAEHWDNKRLLSLIFEPGFSTAAVTDMDAGRGMGMDIIKDRIQKMRGKIQVATKQGQFTRFTVTLPMAHINNQVA